MGDTDNPEEFKIFRTLFRRKTDLNFSLDTDLTRILNTFDLTLLGVGSTLGAGIYVFAGSIINSVAGPSAVISFLIAAVSAFLTGLCYAELGARMPKSGSSYIYTYAVFGELLAFIVGWSLILQYFIGTSFAANALSMYFDSLVDNKIQNTLKQYLKLDVIGFLEYPAILILGTKLSIYINNFSTVLNLVLILLVVSLGLFFIDFGNWSIYTAEKALNSTISIIESRTCKETELCGNGGFFPFGINGVFNGAAKCFYVFTGFDRISLTGEEAINANSAIPTSIIITLSIFSLSYCAISAILSLMVPYFLISSHSSISKAFSSIGWYWTEYFVIIGIFLGLFSSLFGALYPLSRIIYSISSDNLLFRFLSDVNERFKTPINATVLGGFLSAFFALFFNLEDLISLASLATLLCYSISGLIVIILRYENDDTDPFYANLEENYDKYKSFAEKLININPEKVTASERTFNIVYRSTIISGLSIVIVCLFISLQGYKLLRPASYPFEAGLFGLFVLICIFSCIIIMRQPQNQRYASFKAPFIPVLPLLCILVNFYLMTYLSLLTWIRFLVWTSIGLIIYFAYGMENSIENEKTNFESFSNTSRALSVY